MMEFEDRDGNPEFIDPVYPDSQAQADMNLCREFAKWVVENMDKHSGEKMLIWTEDGTIRMRPA